MQAAGDEAGAETQFRRALETLSRNADAELLLGSLLGKLNRADEAKAHLLQAISANPDLADAHSALGNVHLMCGDFEAAQRAYAKALRLDSSNPAIFFNIGFLHQCRLEFHSALENFERAFALSPEMPGLVRSLTMMRVELGLVDRAGEHLAEMGRQRPDDFEVMFAMGYVLQHRHRPELAIGFFERARRQQTPDIDLLLNHGIVLRDLGRIDEALENFSAALAVKPAFELALWHQSLTYLLLQDFARGWENYDLRLSSRDRPQRPLTFPEWKGQDTSGMRVLIFGEQGIGDEIMFASCLPQMIAASRTCIVECSERLLGLFRRSFPDAIVRASTGSTAVASRESCDVQIAMGSLPRFLRKTGNDFTRHQGYLRAAPKLRDKWRARLAAMGPGPKVGISWQGGTQKTRSPVRSMPLERLAPLLGTAGVHFIDLQYTDCGAEIETVEARLGLRIHRWREAREDFEETAALVAELDLVISVCNTVVHLGGALGKAVWVLAPFSPEWRYGIRGVSMPWYPSVRAFRQASYAAWDPVIEDVAQSLRIWRDGTTVASGR